MAVLREENRTATTAHDDSTQTTLTSNRSGSDAPSTETKKSPEPEPVGRRVSRGTTTTEGSLTRVRSYNAYGCDTDVEWEDMGMPPREGEERDPFLVSWEGLEDPMNPRSKHLALKWMIVLINSSAALCV